MGWALAWCGRSSRLIALVTGGLLAATLMVIGVSAPPAYAINEVDAPAQPKRCHLPGTKIAKPGCKITKFKAKRPTVIIWGDSHAIQMIPAINRAVQGKNVNLVSHALGSCPPAKVVPPKDGRTLPLCERNNMIALQWVRKAVKSGRTVKVLLASNWTGFRQAYRTMKNDREAFREIYGGSAFHRRMFRLANRGTPRLFKSLAKIGVHTDVVGQAATVPLNARWCLFGTDPYSATCSAPRPFRRSRAPTGG